MRALRDTHAFLWWITDDPRLPARVRAIAGDPQTDLLLSTASGWESAIRVGIGKLRLPDDPQRYIPDQLARNGTGVLPIQLAHALRVLTLPDLHADPFDRLLVAQAQVEGLPILTADPHIARYPVEVIWQGPAVVLRRQPLRCRDDPLRPRELDPRTLDPGRDAPARPRWTSGRRRPDGPVACRARRGEDEARTP